MRLIKIVSRVARENHLTPEEEKQVYQCTQECINLIFSRYYGRFNNYEKKELLCLYGVEPDMHYYWDNVQKQKRKRIKKEL